MTSRKHVLWRSLGFLSVVPVVLTGIPLISLEVPFFPFLITAVIMSLLISATYSVLGLKAGMPWMLIWMLAFVVLLPISNVVFWLVHRRLVQ